MTARGMDRALHVERDERTNDLLAHRDRVTCPDERERLADEIVELNLPLSDAVARRYANRGVETDDLIQVARTALVLAVRRYRPDRGASFAAYAVPTIAGELKRHFRDHCWSIRPPRRMQELRTQLRDRSADLAQQLGRGATAGDLATDLGLDESDVLEAMTLDGAFRPVSLDAPLDPHGGRDESSFASCLTQDDDAAERITDRVTLRRLLVRLSRRDQLILRWRFADDCTQSTIAQRLGVSQMQVSRLLTRVLARLRRAMFTDLDRSPLQAVRGRGPARPAIRRRSPGAGRAPARAALTAD